MKMYVPPLIKLWAPPLPEVNSDGTHIAGTFKRYNMLYSSLVEISGGLSFRQKTRYYSNDGMFLSALARNIIEVKCHSSLMTFSSKS